MPNQYQKNRIIATVLFVVLFISVGNVLSEELTETNAADSNVSREEALPVLPQITVTGVRIAPMTGATILDRELIQNLPSRNGTINDLISIVPGVQYAEDSLHSFTGGEITPPRISISGGRFYENNYTIDGFSNNSSLDPATGSLINDIPGHPQQIFLDPHLVEQITVYDSNIPAEHGGFTGGLVEAETLDPVDEFWGNINYRTTRDSWTKFHISSEDQDAFDNSETAAKQPEFTKHDGGFALNAPVATDMGLLISYQRLESDIPLLHFGSEKKQSRLSENFFLKYGYHISNSSRLYLTAIHAPNKNEYFTTSKNDDYTLKSRTSSLTAHLEQDFDAGTLELNLGYSYQKSDRDAPQDKYRWSTETASIDWDKGIEGGGGNLDTSQEDYEFRSSFAFSEFATGRLSHQATIGAEAEHSTQKYNRPETSYYYNYFSNPSSPYHVVIDPTIECNGAVACIDNEQYLVLRYVYEEGDSKASFNRYAAFLQDAMAWHRLELFPGVRISHDNYTDNTNYAPRLSASYDLFGNRKSIFFGGANRYYSENLLTNKLREARSPSGLYETREDLDSEFETANDGLYLWRSTDLKTPYSDEITLGLIQDVLGGPLKLQYIKRTSKDEIATERTSTQPDGYRYYQFNNNGRSEHKSYQFSWQRTWRKHYLEINGTYQETDTSNLTYNDTVDDDDTEELVWYNGDALEYDEIPRKDFNRPSVVNLVYTGRLPYDITFTNRTKYRHKYYRLKNTGDKHTLENGEEIYIYIKERRNNSVTFDWRLAWAASLGRTQTVLSLDIYNVFNNKSNVSYKDDEYVIGRQFWAGAEVNF